MSRVFVGIPTPIDLSRELKNWRQALEHEKWTHKVDYHMTLAFIGSIEDPGIPPILDVLSHVASLTPSFEFSVD